MECGKYKNSKKLTVMKTLLKNPVGYCGILFMVFIFLGTFGCTTSKSTLDPLAGWQIAFKEDPSPAVEKDIQAYIHDLPSAQQGYIGTEFYYKNGSGGHAVSIEVFEGNRNASWQHVLFYDKSDRRIKAVRYGYCKYES
jgi:hypothetical protein